MSLFAGYMREKEKMDVIEIDDKGFLSYRLDKKVAHVDIIYVDPKFRREGIGTQLADMLYEKHNKEIEALTAVVDVSHNNPTSSMKAILSYGFEIVGISHKNNNEILLYKDLMNE